MDKQTRRIIHNNPCILKTTIPNLKYSQMPQADTLQDHHKNSQFLAMKMTRNQIVHYRLNKLNVSEFLLKSPEITGAPYSSDHRAIRSRCECERQRCQLLGQKKHMTYRVVMVNITCLIVEDVVNIIGFGALHQVEFSFISFRAARHIFNKGGHRAVQQYFRNHYHVAGSASPQGSRTAGRELSLPTQVSPPSSHRGQGTVECLHKTPYGQVRPIRIGLADHLRTQIRSMVRCYLGSSHMQPIRSIASSSGQMARPHTSRSSINLKIAHCSFRRECSCSCSVPVTSSKIADSSSP